MKSRPPRLSSDGSEPDLLSQLDGLDREAFELLYETYFARVYSYFRRRFETVAAAEEATEEALTAIFDAISTGRAQLPLKPWILSKVRAVERDVRSQSLAKVSAASRDPRLAVRVRS